MTPVVVDHTKQKDKWSAHLEYLKMVMTLTVATITIVVAVYSDPAKIPIDESRFWLLAFGTLSLLALACALIAVACTANIVAGAVTRTRPVTWSATGSFVFLFLSVGSLLYFLVLRTQITGMTDEQRALDAARAFVEKSNRAPGDTVSLANFDIATAGKYVLVFQLAPGPRSVTLTVDAKTSRILSASAKP